MKSRSWIIISVLSGILVLAAASCGTNRLPGRSQPRLAEPADRPNIILVTISSLRADHVSSLGYRRQTTPNFDTFARNHFLFTEAFATSSWQMPAVGSIFTSLRPRDHGATHIDRTLDPNIRTLAGVLRENGFYTAGFGCNPRLSSDYGFDMGFDFYDDYSVAMILSSLAFDPAEIIDINKRRTNDLVNDAVIRWLRSNTHEPFFLSVHYYDNHWDYLPPPPYDTYFDPDYAGDIDGTEIAREPLYSNRPADRDVEHIIALYDGQVRQTDEDLGYLLDFLQAQGRFEDSFILIMGDHGEQFYEHGHTSHHGIFEELIHVPLAIAVPGVATAAVVDSLASGVDIMPTILDYAHIPIPVGCRGHSLRHRMEGKTGSPREYIAVEYTGGAVPDCFAIRFEQYKFVRREGDIFAYDLKADPTEQKKIAEEDFTPEMQRSFEEAAPLLTEE